MTSEDVRNIVTRDKGSAASQIMKWSVYVELTTALEKEETDIFLMEVTRCITRNFLTR